MAKDKQQHSGVELIPANESQLPALPPDVQAEIEAAVAADLKAGGFDLPRIEIVHAAQCFKFPGEENPIARFRGFLLGEHRFNVYWQKRGENDGGNVPPDCSARDGVNASRPAETTEVIDPNTGEVKVVSIFGKCATCWFNQFGSAANGSKGKACANKANILIWPHGKDAIMPYLLTVSSTSLAGGVQSLAQKEIRNVAMAVYNSPQIGTLAEFWLEKKQNGNQVWSVLHAEAKGGIGDRRGTVSSDEWIRIKEFVGTFLPQLNEAPLNGDEQPTQDAEVINYTAEVAAPADPFEEARAKAVNI